MATIKSVSNADLRSMMVEGKVTFQFKKKDGSIRTANGTLKSSLITKTTHGGVNYPKGAGYSTYFDLDKNDFRCYAESQLIGVVEE